MPPLSCVSLLLALTPHGIKRLLQSPTHSEIEEYSRHGWNVVHVGLCDHGRHCLLHRTLPELVQTVLIPHSLEVKVRSIQERLEEGHTSRMSDTRIAL